MKAMYVASLLALLSLFGATNAFQLTTHKQNEHRLEDLENKRPEDGVRGPRNLIHWLQPVQGVKRAEESSYIRFGKRNGNEVETIEEPTNLLSGYRPRRTSQQSSYIRFGKRSRDSSPMTSSPSSMTSSSSLMTSQLSSGLLSFSNECIAEAMRQSRTLAQFHDMLLTAGCFQIQKRQAAKKDGYIRFGKRAAQYDNDVEDGHEPDAEEA